MSPDRTVGQNEVTPLDLAQFERSHARELAINVRDGAQPGVGQMLRAVEQFDALLAECKRLRADRAKLVEALRDSISDLQTMERHYPESAKTVLERRRALLRSLGEDARSHGARV
ncbi:MAG: hypothetical protein Q8P46_11960 [Hyphomicrobiales bacterium]|nr:hypothetical protein [Hyphomicrobiales bacterium]